MKHSENIKMLPEMTATSAAELSLDVSVQPEVSIQSRGESIQGDAPELASNGLHSGEGGSIPASPLQYSFRDVQLVNKPKDHRTDHRCGQAAVAMAASAVLKRKVTLEEACKACETEGPTLTRDLILGLHNLGVGCSDELIRLEKTFPVGVCIAKEEIKDARYFNWLCVVRENDVQITFDPTLAIAGAGKFTSYIAIYGASKEVVNMRAAQKERPSKIKTPILTETLALVGNEPKILVPGVNATDIAFHEIRVPKHPYSQTCYCDACTQTKSPTLFSAEPSKYDPTEDKWKPQDIRYALITEVECKSFMLPRGYLRRWFVGGKLFIGGISPKGYLVCGMALSSPGAFGKRFTSKNTLEVRRMFMEDCCEKNCESAFIAWVCRFIKSRCPQIKYIITFGDPRYDKETPYLAAGFTKELAKNSNDWSTHKSHRSRESPTDKIRLVYRTWAKDIIRSNVPGMRQESLPFDARPIRDEGDKS